MEQDSVVTEAIDRLVELNVISQSLHNETNGWDMCPPSSNQPTSSVLLMAVSMLKSL